jgi:hypothetical protein
MEQLTNTSYLCNKLIEINKKYESNSFIDIDFINLFGLRSKTTKTVADLDKIKKKLTMKYYNLILKYHPDKCTKSDKNIINIDNCFISVDEIKSGKLVSFITDIYTMFNEMMSDDGDIESLIEIINGNTDDFLNKVDMNGDYYNLKRRFDGNVNKDYVKATEEQMREFEEELNKVKIADSKINEDQLISLIELEQNKREKSVEIERIFTQEEQFEPDFNKKFNDVFDTNKNSYMGTSTTSDNDSTNTNIMAFNFNNNYDLSIGVSSVGLSSSITDLSEAFGPIRVNNNMKQQSLTYEQLLVQRREQENLFKIPNNQKSSSK